MTFSAPTRSEDSNSTTQVYGPRLELGTRPEIRVRNRWRRWPHLEGVSANSELSCRYRMGRWVAPSFVHANPPVMSLTPAWANDKTASTWSYDHLG
jgi:hypothetical protein